MPLQFSEFGKIPLLSVPLQFSEFGKIPLLFVVMGPKDESYLTLILVLFFFFFFFAEPGDYVAREGEPVDGLCIILDGQVKFIQILTFVGSMHTYTT